MTHKGWRVVKPHHNIFKDFFNYRYILQYSVILYADSEGPDELAHVRKLIRAFAVRIAPQGRIHF